MIKSLLNYKKSEFYFFIFLSILIFLISINYGMFDDDILFGSKMGNQLYYNSIFNWNMPDSFDPGHPPFLGFILTVFWNIFGHHLWVSHLAMLPFTFGFFYQLHKFISYFVKERSLQFCAFILIIVDPSLSTCFVLVNMEIIMLFFFFLAVNSILKNKILFKFIGLLFLSIVSYRSMMLFAGIFLFDVLNKLFIQKEVIKKIITIKFILLYFLSSLPAFIFVGWRLLTKGWLQTHPNSPWSGMWHFADFKYFIRNLVVLVWRYLDFGRIFIMLLIVISFFIYGKKIIKSIKNKQILLLAISSVILIIITIISVTNSVGIRYFIVSYICFNLFSFIIISKYLKLKKVLYFTLLIGLITGNLWIYPKELSQGWRATLGHLPYHSLRIKAIDYLNNEHIDVSEVGSFFPNYTTLDLIDFSGDKRSFAKFTGKNKYVFYATVYNLTEEDLNILNNNYTILKEFNNFNTTITIYILDTK
ncbi:hypothetical protein [Polaribacter sp. Hel1_85]|uniref:hypothetical protein n=1 Tax=Polaribacter sp. Hel1_85 TaxID=1250005 RepID=UPI00052BFCC1|nr:hypothetical protein [Polaribacter sp. Hel1_85]KGL63731.1 conserved hypothetical membrane protein [Polaribacter sp. Hel1_85]